MDNVPEALPLHTVLCGCGVAPYQDPCNSVIIRDKHGFKIETDGRTNKELAEYITHAANNFERLFNAAATMRAMIMMLNSGMNILPYGTEGESFDAAVKQLDEACDAATERKDSRGDS